LCARRVTFGNRRDDAAGLDTDNIKAYNTEQYYPDPGGAVPNRTDTALKPHVYHVLLALADGPRHGLEIQREVTRASEGAVRLWPVKLYRSLEELSAQGLIEPLDGAAHPAGASERRRYHRLLPAGRRALAEETERLARVIALARSRAAARKEAR